MDIQNIMSVQDFAGQMTKKRNYWSQQNICDGEGIRFSIDENRWPVLYAGRYGKRVT